jgi:hypothetical protein
MVKLSMFSMFESLIVATEKIIIGVTQLCGYPDLQICLARAKQNVIGPNDLLES